MRDLISLPYTFVIMNWAAVVGLYYFLIGKKDVWSKDKSAHSHRH